MPKRFPRYSPRIWIQTPLLLLLMAILVFGSVAGGAWAWWREQQSQRQVGALEFQLNELQTKLEFTELELAATQASLSALLNQDQLKRNNELEAEIANIQRVYKSAVDRYEDLLQLRLPTAQSQPLEKYLTNAFVALSRRDYTTATTELTKLNAEIDKQIQAAVAAIPANVPAIQEAPTSGVRRQSVSTDFGTYLVDVIAADLNSTRVVVETASASDCANDCPVDSLAAFVARAGGYAGINGPYFCPAEYPSCAGKTNSFDTLLMNRYKTYFNSDNNVYSVVPAVVFSGNSANFLGQSLQVGRDTGVDSVIAAQPLLLMNGEVRFGGDGDPKKGSRGSRSFIGAKGNTVYIGVVRGATVAEVAHVLKAMGLENALNLDSGGSTALYSGGRYLAGPGRNTPFGIVLVRK